MIKEKDIKLLVAHQFGGIRTITIYSRCGALVKTEIKR